MTDTPVSALADALAEHWRNGNRSYVLDALGSLPPLRAAATAARLADLLDDASDPSTLARFLRRLDDAADEGAARPR